MYAQVLKNRGYLVNLVGGSEVGLPIEHPDVICIDIGDRTDVKENMTYNPETNSFTDSFPSLEPSPEPPTTEDRLMAVEEALLMIL